MKSLVPTLPLRRIILSHLPLLGVLLILAFFALINSPALGQYRSEETFGWMVVLWIPLGILLGLSQLYIWARWFFRLASPASRKHVTVGFLIVLMVFLSFVLLRHLS